MEMKTKKTRRMIIFVVGLCMLAIFAASVYANKNRILSHYGEKYPVLTKVLGPVPVTEGAHDACGCGHDHSAPAEKKPATSADGHNHAPGEVCPSEAAKKTAAPAPAAAKTDHDHAKELVFTSQALKNIGVTKETLRLVAVGNLPLTMNFPAIVAERPGRSTTNMTAPVSGIVLRIYRQPGEMLFPGEPMLDMDLSNESEVAQQMELLSLCQKLEIVDQELGRLAAVAEGLVTKTIRETEFEKRQLESDIQALVKTLTLSGFAEEDIRRVIVKERRLIRQVTIPVPAVDDDRLCTLNTLRVRDEDAATVVHEPQPVEVAGHETHTHTDACDAKNQEHLQLVQLFVEKGQRVSAGGALCRIADMSQLYLCGRAWDYDEAVLMDSLAKNVPVTAVFQTHDAPGNRLPNTGNVMKNLRMKYVDNMIDADSRTLNFYVEFKNELLGCACPGDACRAVGATKQAAAVKMVSATKKTDAALAATAASGDSRALHWKYRPGQRCELQVQYDTVPNCVLLPKEAVAASGIEFYVFRLVHVHGDYLSLVPVSVHVVRQGKDVVAVANDGALPKDAVVAMRGASQLVVAMNAASGSGAGPESACPCDNH